MDSDNEDLSDSENEEDDILRSAAELVPVNEVFGGENEAGDVHHTGPSSNITTSNSGSSSHTTRRTQHEFRRDYEHSDLEESNGSTENLN